MAKRRAAPPGLDYVPVPGDDPDLIFGVVRATLGEMRNTATGAIMRRLFPVSPPLESAATWPQPTCYHHDVTLPPWANSDYRDPRLLARAYDEQGWAGIKDVAIMLSFRFPETTSAPPLMTVNAAFELVRGFAHQKLSLERDLAVVLAVHVPGRAGQQGLPPHVHAMCLARTLGALGFGPFVRPLATDAGRPIIEAEWAKWREERGQ